MRSAVRGLLQRRQAAVDALLDPNQQQHLQRCLSPSAAAATGVTAAAMSSSWRCWPTAGASADAARASSSQHHCSTSSSALQQTPPAWPQQVTRGYAKAAGKGGGKSTLSSSSTSSAVAAADPLAPPSFTVKRVPQVYKGDPLTRTTAPQRVLLEEVSGSSGPLRSLRQVGWPLRPKEVLALWHDQLSSATGTNVSVTPFVLEGMFCSAASLAGVVKEYITKGRGMPQVEQALLTTIANTPPAELPFEGLKVQLKGRMSGKGGKASKKVWEWGRTSAANLADPLDYAHEAIITRAGYIGVKVWIKYKRSHMAPQAQRSSRSSVSVAQVLGMPSPQLLSTSSSAWWAVPAPLQPQQHRTWQAFKPGYDPLTASWQPRQPAAAAVASSSSDSSAD